jgi:Ser/Thr protein kinase RdoA (MazF antagonist)
MTKDTVVEILESSLVEHPAAVAWRKFAPGFVEPRSIVVLKRRGHSSVYRLEGAGLSGAAVIVKRCGRAAAEIERAVYADILPALPVTALHLYGCQIEDREREGNPPCWLFLEDAAGERYSTLVEEHRSIAGQWLGAMHASAARLHAPTGLPEVGPGHYLGKLRSVAEVIHRSFANPALHAPDLIELEAILVQFAVLESHWEEIAAGCDGMPRTLVHGDLATKNARVRSSRAGASLVVMDWETAGWGAPAIDLAQSVGSALSPDLAAYLSAVAAWWPDAASLIKMAEAGKIFRLIAAANWAVESLASPWVERCVRNLRIYRAAMADSIREAGWGN